MIIKKVSRRDVHDYSRVIDVDGFYEFMRGKRGGLFLLEPLKQLKEISTSIITKRKNTVLSLDTFIGLIKEIYGIKHYKHKFYNLIFLFAILEKFYEAEFVFLFYNEKLANRVLTTRSSKAISLQLIKS